MDYKINQFNLCNINFSDLSGLINCFENSIPYQKISTIYLGNNLLHFSDINNKYKKFSEDKKLINSQAQLILNNLENNQKNEEFNFIYTTSNLNSKYYLKRLLKDLNRISNESNDFNEGKQILNFFQFLSFFTCLKDSFDDEISITDYLIKISIEKGIKYENILFFQFNYEFIIDNNMGYYYKNIEQNNNIHFFYMLLYNLHLKDLEYYLFCDETKNLFEIFKSNENENNNNNKEIYNRFIFCHNFKLIKNNSLYNFVSNVSEKEGFSLIYKEYNFYYNLYQKYLNLKEYLMINQTTEKKLIGIYLAILLLKEYDFSNDSIFSILTNNLQINLSNNVDLYSFIRNNLLEDSRFNYLDKKNNELNEFRKNSSNILSKISYNLNISEEKIIYILLNNQTNKNERIVKNIENVNSNINQLITILYLISIDNIKNIFTNFEKQKKFYQKTNSKQINIYLSRSNLVYESVYDHLNLNDNNFFTISNNIIDSNSYIIYNNIREHIINNYIQELKNFLYLNNSLNNLGTEKKFPKMKFNSVYLNEIYLDNFNFDEIMNLYENNICGLLKILNENINFSNFKINFNKYIYIKGKIEIVEVFNGLNNLYQNFVKVKHTFGTFLYDLKEIFNNHNNNNLILPNNNKERLIYQFLEYKPVFYNNNYFKFNKENSIKYMKKIIENNNNYITVCINNNKYNIITLFDDLKLNTIYFYYNNFYNFVINIKDIKEIIIKNNLMNLSNNLLNINSSMSNEKNFIKFLFKKIKISKNDYYIENGYIFSKKNLSFLFDNDKNLSNILFKYNYTSFLLYFCEKISKSKFNYFKYIINSIRAFVKLTKIYNEKRTISNVRNLLSDCIVDNYNININNEENDINNFNNILIPKIDKLDELIFDFKKESLSKILPKLRTNLLHLKKIWKDYINEIEYLEKNVFLFSNQENTQIDIEQRIINFQILLFLFSKKYKFINSDNLKKFGVLLNNFTKTVSADVLKMLKELKIEFEEFLKINVDFNKKNLYIKKNYEMINFEKILSKRIEIQNISRKNSLKNNNNNDDKLSSNSNSIRNNNNNNNKDFNISPKELDEGRSFNHKKNSRKPSINNLSIQTITRNGATSKENLINNTSIPNSSNESNNSLIRIKKELNNNNNAPLSYDNNSNNNIDYIKEKFDVFNNKNENNINISKNINNNQLNKNKIPLPQSNSNISKNLENKNFINKEFNSSNENNISNLSENSLNLSKKNSYNNNNNKNNKNSKNNINFNLINLNELPNRNKKIFEKFISNSSKNNNNNNENNNHINNRNIKLNNYNEINSDILNNQNSTPKLNSLSQENLYNLDNKSSSNKNNNNNINNLELNINSNLNKNEKKFNNQFTLSDKNELEYFENVNNENKIKNNIINNEKNNLIINEIMNNNKDNNNNDINLHYENNNNQINNNISNQNNKETKINNNNKNTTNINKNNIKDKIIITQNNERNSKINLNNNQIKKSNSLSKNNSNISNNLNNSFKNIENTNLIKSNSLKNYNNYENIDSNQNTKNNNNIIIEKNNEIQNKNKPKNNIQNNFNFNSDKINNNNNKFFNEINNQSNNSNNIYSNSTNKRLNYEDSYYNFDILTKEEKQILFVTLSNENPHNYEDDEENIPINFFTYPYLDYFKPTMINKKSNPQKLQNLFNEIQINLNKKNNINNSNLSNYNNFNNNLDSQNTFSNKNNNNNNEYYYYLEETKNLNSLNIPALKELDEKISLLRKEINSLDIMENIAEQANLLCLKEMNYNINNNNNINENNNINDEEILKQIEETNKDFYEEIESKLQMAEEALTYQNLNYNNNNNNNDDN